jgi:hypothetical protein
MFIVNKNYFKQTNKQLFLFIFISPINYPFLPRLQIVFLNPKKKKKIKKKIKKNWEGLK